MLIGNDKNVGLLRKRIHHRAWFGWGSCWSCCNADGWWECRWCCSHCGGKGCWCTIHRLVRTWVWRRREKLSRIVFHKNCCYCCRCWTCCCCVDDYDGVVGLMLDVRREGWCIIKEWKHWWLSSLTHFFLLVS